MPIRINQIWRVTWCQPNNGIVRALLVPGRLGDDPRVQPEELLGNFLRERGEAKIGEVYRVIIEPAFPYEQKG